MTWPIVYLATNRVNGKRYVGVTSKTLAKRRWQHENDAKRRVDSCPAFHAALRKHEWQFSWEILGTFESLDDALRAEISAIADLAPEYNITAGREGSIRVWTAAARRPKARDVWGSNLLTSTGAICRWSVSGKNGLRKLREKITAALRPILIARNKSPEQRAKVSAATMGHPGYGKGKKKDPEAVRRGWETRRRNQMEAAL